MGYLSAGDFTPNMRQQAHDPRRLAAARAAGSSGMGALGGRKSRAMFAALQQSQAAEEAANAEIRSGQAAIDSDMSKIGRALSAVRDAAGQAGSISSQLDDPSSFSLVQIVQSGASDVQGFSDEAEAKAADLASQFESKRSAGQLAASKPFFSAAADSIRMLQQRASKTTNQVAEALSRLLSMSRKVAQIQTAQQTAAQQTAQIQYQQQQAQAAAEERRYQLQQQQEQAQRQREDAAEARRQAAEAQSRQDAAQARADAIAREDALQQRQDAAETARQAAEAARAQAVIDAEARKDAMKQEALLRQEEAQLRREEREAELQRLMTMQELAAKGVPSMFAPPGAASYGPSMPAVALPPGYPAGGYPGAPAGYPGGYPGMPQGPYPGQAPPGYAATPAQAPAPAAPPAWGKGGASAAPAGPLPEGMAWASLDPGNEMFGMGGMGAFVPTTNLRLRGARLEQGYTLRGPLKGGIYQINDASGSTVWNGDEDALSEPIADADGVMIYQPPRQGGGGVTGQDVASIISASIQTAGNVFTETERTKQARAAAKAGRRFPVSDDSGYDQGAPAGGSGSGWGGLVLVGSLGLAGLLIASAFKSRKKPANAKPANATKNAKA